MPTPRMDYMQPYLTLTEIIGRPLPPDQLANRMAKYRWESSFFVLAQLAAALANRGGPNSDFAKDHTVRQLRALSASLNLFESAVANYVLKNDHRIIAHDQVVQFLQALVLLYGKDDGQEAPSELELAIWLLSANDHIHAWLDEEALPPTPVEDVFVNLAHVSRFNISPDPLRLGVRTRLMFEAPPQKGLFSSQADWEALQHATFGRPYVEHFEAFVEPLFLMSQVWGLEVDGQISLPVIEPQAFFAQTAADQSAAAAFLEGLTLTREKARQELRKRMRGVLPHAPTLFYHHPLVRADDGNLIAASPFVMLEHLKAGIWSKFMFATAKVGRRRDDWPPVFGYLFEAWCRRVAYEAARSPSFKDKLIVSRAIGDETEIEDVVFYDGQTAVLCSAKARLVREEEARQAKSIRKTLAWYEQFFFAEKAKRHRPGALRLLDAKVSKIRAGAYSEIPPSTCVIPMIVTFDSIGDTPAMYKWLANRLASTGLLAQQNVSTAILSNVDGFELLMSLAANGYGVVDVCTHKVQGEWEWARFTDYLYDIAARHKSPRLPFFGEVYEQMGQAIASRLFPNQSESP